MLSAELAPKVQAKFHKDVIPVLTEHMLSEPTLKMSTQATSAALSFVGGLAQEGDDNDDIDSKKILSNYTKPLLQACVTLLQKAIASKYEPL